MRTKKNKLFFAFLIISMLIGIAFSCLSRYYFGKTNSKINDEINEYIYSDTIYSIEDFLKKQSKNNPWIKNSCKKEVYAYSVDNKEIMNNDLIEFQDNGNSIKMNGVFNGYIKYINTLDNTCVVKYELKSVFESDDTLDIINYTNEGFLLDGILTKKEIKEDIKYLNIPQKESINCKDLNKFAALNYIFLEDVSNLNNLNIDDEVKIYVALEKYQNFISFFDELHHEYAKQLFVKPESENQVSVTFHTNGGKFLNSDVNIDYKTCFVSKNSKIEDFNNYSLNKNGYVFLGWYDYNDNQTKIDLEDYCFDKDIKLVAKFRNYKFKIRYYLPDVDNDILLDEEEYEFSDKEQLAPLFENKIDAKYVFLGWSRDRNSLFADYEDGFKVNEKLSIYNDGEEINLYAICAYKNFSIEYYQNGNKIFEQNDGHYLLPFTLSCNKPTEFGKTFLGWSKNNDSKFAEFQLNETITNQSNSQSLYAVASTANVVKLHAIFGVEKYDIVYYDINDNEIRKENKILDNDYNIWNGKNNVDNNSTKEDYHDSLKVKGLHFVGWQSINEIFIFEQFQSLYNINSNVTIIDEMGTLKGGFKTNGTVTLRPIYVYNNFQIKNDDNNVTLNATYGKDLQLNYEPSLIGNTFTGFKGLNAYNQVIDIASTMTVAGNRVIPAQEINKIYDIILEREAITDNTFEKGNNITFNISNSFSPNYYSIYINVSNATAYINDSKVSGTYNVTYNTSFKITYSINNGYELVSATFDGAWVNSGDTRTMPARNVTLKIETKEEPTCLIEDTKLNLKDGTSKNIQDIKLGDEIMTYNFENGEIVASKIVYLEENAKDLRNIIYLIFDDGEEIGVDTEHGFFDVESKKYV